MNNCPCSSNKDYDACCGIFITKKSLPKTPEELMRSRYSAYFLKDIDYIADTMQGPAAQGFVKEEAQKWADQLQWTQLEVLNSKIAGAKGWVEFKAHYIENGKKNILHEKSEFILDDNKWYYTDGVFPGTGIGRNEPCPCGSHKKYKKCCLK